jgi:hypothetical protein
MSLKPLPSSFITSDIVTERVSNYKNGAHQLLSEQLSKNAGEPVEDTRSVWYSTEQLMEWLSELVHYNGDGLRIYIGQREKLKPGERYDDTSGEPRPGQLCLLIVPTKKGETEDSHINMLYKDLPDFEARKAISKTANAGQEGQRAFNFGGYCPPLCPLEGIDF